MLEVTLNGIILSIYKVNKTDNIIKLINHDRVYSLYTHKILISKLNIKIGSIVKANVLLSKSIDKTSLISEINKNDQIKINGWWGNYYFSKFFNIASQKQKSTKEFYENLLLISKLLWQENAFLAWTWLLAQFIKSEGVIPIIDKCVDCGKSKNIFSFEIESGGLKCKQHAFHVKKEQSIDYILQFIYLFKYDYLKYSSVVDVHKLVIIEKSLRQYINNHMGIFIENDKI